MFKHLKEAAVAVAVVAAVPALACAQTISYGAAPVSVTSCATSETASGGPISFAGQMIRTTDSIDLGYVNTSTIAAASITFLVNDGNRQSSITARGSFAPGVHINRSFDATNDGVNAAAACKVAEVRFVDGSVWQTTAPTVVGIR